MRRYFDTSTRSRHGTRWLLATHLTVFAVALSLPPDGRAAEGASSNYFPGAYGVLLPGLAPDPGFIVANLSLFYSGEADRAVRNGAVNIEIEADAFYS